MGIANILLDHESTDFINVTVEDYLRMLQKLEFKHYIPSLIFLVFIAVTGTIGNILVLIVYKTKYHKNSTRTLIMLLAVVDLMTCAVCIPGQIHTFFHLWDYDSALECKLLYFSTCFAITTSGFSLLALAVVRYRKVCHPFEWQVTEAHAECFIVGIIVYCIIVSAPFAIICDISTRTTYFGGTHGTECGVSDDYFKTIWPIANSIFSGIEFTVVCLCLIALYFQIGRKGYKHRNFHGVGLPEKQKLTTKAQAIAFQLESPATSFSEVENEVLSFLPSFLHMKRENQAKDDHGSSTDGKIELIDIGLQEENDSEGNRCNTWMAVDKRDGYPDTLLFTTLGKNTDEKANNTTPEDVTMRRLVFPSVSQICCSRKSSQQLETGKKITKKSTISSLTSRERNFGSENTNKSCSTLVPSRSNVSRIVHSDCVEAPCPSAEFVRCAHLQTQFCRSSKVARSTSYHLVKSDRTHCDGQQEAVIINYNSTLGLENENLTQSGGHMSENNNDSTSASTSASTSTSTSTSTGTSKGVISNFVSKTNSVTQLKKGLPNPKLYRSTINHNSSNNANGRNNSSRQNRNFHQSINYNKTNRNRTNLNLHIINRTTGMLFLITSVFIVNFLPSIVIIIMDTSSNRLPVDQWLVSIPIQHLLKRSYLLNSAANFVVYSLCHPHFRHEVFKLFWCCRKNEYKSRIDHVTANL